MVCNFSMPLCPFSSYSGCIIEDEIAGSYYRLWAQQVISKADAREEIAVKTLCLGAAFLMRRLVTTYDEGKAKLRELIRDVSPELATDYDLLREGGVNPRLSESFLKLAPEDITRLQVTDALEFLEAIAPGLSILLRSDFLRVATRYSYHHIAPDSKFVHAQFLGTESRELVEKGLSECKQQMNDMANFEATHIELFEILSGADNGPWRARSPCGFSNFRQLQVINLSWYKRQPESARRQRAHDRLSSSWGSPSDSWSFMHTTSSGPDLSVLSSASSAFNSGASEESASHTPLIPEHDRSQ